MYELVQGDRVKYEEGLLKLLHAELEESNKYKVVVEENILASIARQC